MRIVIATGGTADLAEEIIDDTQILVFFKGNGYRMFYTTSG